MIGGTVRVQIIVNGYKSDAELTREFTSEEGMWDSAERMLSVAFDEAVGPHVKAEDRERQETGGGF